ncbi:MAG: carbon storage regulator [Acidiferrobacterales bacterium]
MLLLTRKPGQSIELDLANIDPEMSVGELLTNGSIEIHVVGVEGSKVKLGIETRPGGARR